MHIQAVVFDLDGTLLDSLADIAHAANWVLALHGFATHDVPAYRYYVGDGVRHLLRRTLPPAVHDDRQLFEQLIAEFVDRYQEAWNIESRLYDGVPELLDQLVARHVTLAVLSNKPHSATCRCVQHYLAQYPFAAVLGQNESRPPKPDLTGVREILSTLEVPPLTCLYLGDTAVDMQTAQGAGMVAVGATWGFRERDELAQAGAKYLVDHPLEVLKLLGR